MDPEKINELFESVGKVKFLVFQLERGKLNGYKHYQGVLCFKNAVSFISLKKLFPNIHLEVVKGNLTHAIDYARKSQTRINGPYEFGKEPHQGERSDLFDIHLMIEDGRSLAEIRAKHPTQYMIYQKNIKNFFNEFHSEKYLTINRPVICVYLYGKTGIGKTRIINENFNSSHVYRVTDYSHPFDEYLSEPILVLDEYRGNFEISYLLNILDVYPMKLRARYNNKTACYYLVVILSNLPLEKIYSSLIKKEKDSYKALLRRLKINGEFTKNRSKLQELIDFVQNQYITSTDFEMEE